MQQSMTNVAKVRSSTLTDREWLDLYWKYFQQHSQQRVSYFNFFIVFSTVLTTGYVSTFQKGYGFFQIGMAIGLVQLFVAYIFVKLDQRNSQLIKHAESAIRKLEEIHKDTIPFLLFTEEETVMHAQKEKNRHLFFLSAYFTHGRSFRWIYIFFMLLGVAAFTFSLVLSAHQPIKPDHTMINNITLLRR